MSIPLFLDSDTKGRDDGYLRFIYWTLEIDNLEFDSFCEGQSSIYSDQLPLIDLNRIKLHWFNNQLVIKGIKHLTTNSEEYESGDFKLLFDIVDNWNNSVSDRYFTNDDLFSINQDYLWIEQYYYDCSNDYERGTIFRVEDFIFSHLLKSKEIFAKDTPSVELKASEKETRYYRDFMDNFNRSYE